MNFKAKIKVCGMCDAQNIESLTELPVDFIGHIFYTNSKRNVPNATHKLRHNLQKIAVFVDETEQSILAKLAETTFWAVQLHGSESPEFCARLQKKIKVIKAFAIDESFDFNSLKAYEGKVDYFLFDTLHKGKSGGTGKKFDWNILMQYTGKTPYFLSGGIGITDLGELKAIRDERLFAIDVNSRFENVPGQKNIELLRNFIHQLKPNKNVV